MSPPREEGGVGPAHVGPVCLQTCMSAEPTRGSGPRGPSPRLSGQAYLDANLEAPRPSEDATSIWIGTGTLQGEMLPAGPLPTGTLPTGTLPTGTLPVGTLPTGTLPGPFFRLRLFSSAEDLSLVFSEDGSSP